MASLTPPNQYFVLQMYVPPGPLRKKYADTASLHNKNVDNYLSGCNDCVDAGFDLFCPKEKVIYPASVCTEVTPCQKVGHDIMCRMFRKYSINNANTHGETEYRSHLVGYYLYPRSSTGTKTPLRLSNSVGIIDAGYRGEIIVAMDNICNNDYVIEKHQRLVQICAPDMSYPMKVELVDSYDELGETMRGTGGCGSTGV